MSLALLLGMTNNTSPAAAKMTTDEFAAALGWNPRNLGNRFNQLGLLVTCGRCGGSGRYSYNQMDGDRCYGCGGSGKKLPALTAPLLASVQARVAAGELDGYLAEQKRLGEARAQIKPVKAAIDLAWKTGAVHTAYRTTMSMDPGLVVKMVVFDLASQVNALWDESNRLTDSKGDAATTLAALQAVKDQLDAVNARAAAMEHAALFAPRA
jgi:hypothetical protein